MPLPQAWLLSEEKGRGLGWRERGGFVDFDYVLLPLFQILQCEALLVREKVVARVAEANQRRVRHLGVQPVVSDLDSHARV